MKLKSIELQGFKSFVDRTRLEFDEGITAILGPNGCGKSNVVDAVRWVLGEQSAKQLRGGKMDDVIFKGTTKRRPVGMAEVSLVFDNEDHGLPVEFTEVAIKRRVTRDGGSDYFLNGQPCRLKDLRDLFYDSGVNNTSYSIIEESMIKQVLNENNDELLNLLEQGSGITKYKARRKETQRKLDRTQADLVRLYDIIEEIGREVRSLQRQVGKARRHQRLFKEIRALDLLVAGRRHAELDRQEEEARRQLQEFRTQAEAGVGELSRLRADIEAARPKIDEREAERRQLEESLQAFEEELQEHERQVLLLQHRIGEHERRIEDNTLGIQEAADRQKEIESRITSMTAGLEELAGQIEETAGTLAGMNEQLELVDGKLAEDRAALEEASRLNLEYIEQDAAQRSRLRELQVKRENRQERIGILTDDRRRILAAAEDAERNLAELNGKQEESRNLRGQLLSELAELEKAEHDLEDQGAVLQEETSALAARREAAHSTLELLQKLQDDYEGYGRGAREILRSHGEDPGIKGGLADMLRVAPGDAPALEALLSGLLDAVVVRDPELALGLTSELDVQDLGRANLLCGDGFQVGEAMDETLPADGRPAAELITGPGTEIPYLRGLLARTLIFDNREQALAAARGWRGMRQLVCVSRDGLLATSDGMLSGGRGEAQDTGLLGRREKLDELRAEVKRLDGRLEDLKDKAARNKADREDLREKLIVGRSRLADLDEEAHALQVQLAELVHTRDAARQRAGEMSVEQERLAAEVAELAAQEEQLTDLLDESGRLRETSTVDRNTLRRRVQAAEEQRDEIRQQVEELRLAHQRLLSRRRETESTLEHLRQGVAEQFSRRERLAQETEVSRETLQALQDDLETKQEILARGMDERQRRRQVVQAAAEGIKALHAETEGWHQRVQVIEKQRGGFRDQAHEIETLLATLDIKRNNLEERVEQQYEGSFQDLLGNLDEDDLPRELERDEGVFQLDQAEALLGQKKAKLAGLGPINHLALEEFDEKKERLTFLENQRDDVERARDDLQKAINEINRTARKRFLETFEEVRRNYIAVFQTLFKGGRADLQLIRTDDPLESRIHVTAQPTGKVVDTVALLSGGERCLTALSLLFAVYLVKPSPFCILDEADAPLDDTNIGRFVNMLREFSKTTQFLVITHNKLTMETANHLYGVTMMEPGVSSIVSVSFHDVAQTRSDQDLGDAIANRRRRLDEKAGPVEAVLDDEKHQEPRDSSEPRDLADGRESGEDEADRPADEDDNRTLEASE